MALTPSSTISLSDINTALGRSATAPISMGDTAVRFLANQDTGVVTMSAMQNKYTFSGSITVGYFSDGFTDITGYQIGDAGSLSPSTLWGTVYQMGTSFAVGSSMFISNAVAAPGSFTAMRYIVNGVTVTLEPYYGYRDQWWNNATSPVPFTAGMIGNTYNWQFSQA